MRLLSLQASADRRWIYWLFVAPALLAIGAFVIAPIGYAAWLSLKNFNLILGTDSFAGLANYKRVFTDPAFLTVTLRTFLYVAVVTSIDFTFGFSQALLLYELSPGIARIFRGIFLLPILLIPSASAMFWRMIMYGPPNVEFLRMFGLTSVLPPPLSTSKLAFWGIIVTVWWAWSPWVFLLLSGGLESLDQTPIEAAKLDGASYLGIVRYIILPMMRPVIFVTMSFKAVDSFLSFPFIWLMTQGGPGNSTHLLSTYIYNEAFHFLDYGYGSAMAIVMLVMSGVLAWLAASYWQRTQGA